MARTLISIHIPTDEFCQYEVFREIATDFELGTRGTVRVAGLGWLDGQAIYHNFNTMMVTREAGFRKVLTILNRNNEAREYIFNGMCWHQIVETTNQPQPSLFQQTKGHWGLWTAIHVSVSRLIQDLGDLVLRITQPIWVIPSLVIQALEMCIAISAFLYFSIIILVIVVSSILFILSGPQS